MSTSDQPSPPLTRRQLRELRNTASNPVITPEEAAEARAEDVSLEAPAAAEPEAPVVVEPVEAPVADESVAPEAPEAPSEPVDLDATPVTRRQARQQAKARTESIEVVPDSTDAAEKPVDIAPDEPVEVDEVEVSADADEPAALDTTEPEPAEVEEADVVEPEAEAVDDEVDAADADVDGTDAPVEGDAEGAQTADDEVSPTADEVESASDEAEDADEAEGADEAASDSSEDETAADETAADAERAPVVAPALGANLLAGEGIEADLPPSFDHLLVRGGGGGSSSAPNALILSQTPETGSLSVPIMGTGELLITGSYSLPDNYGSTGSTPGSQDGKDVDATLVDGELPPASSPTPIAASSAISTIKSAEDIIKPPAPDKGGRLMMTLAITAGVLALALATVLILAVVNGYF